MRGHITKRAPGSWSIVIDQGRGPATDKRRQKWVSVKGTKREAERRLRDVLTKIGDGNCVEPTKLTLGAHLRLWQEGYAATNVWTATAEGYRIIIERHLIPGLGGMMLYELKTSHLQRDYAKATKNGPSDGKGGLFARTIVHHHRWLR